MYRKNTKQFAIGTRVKYCTNLHTDEWAYGAVVGRADNYGLIVQLDIPLVDGSTASVLDTSVVTIV